MKTRKLLAVLLALVMVMGMLPAGALGESSDNQRAYQVDFYGNSDITQIGTMDVATVNARTGEVTHDSRPLFHISISSADYDKIVFGPGDATKDIYGNNINNIYYFTDPSQNPTRVGAVSVQAEEIILDPEDSTFQSFKDSYIVKKDDISLYDGYVVPDVENNILVFVVFGDRVSGFFYNCLIVSLVADPSGGGSGEEPAEPITYTMSFDDAATIGTLNGRPVYRISLDGKAYDEIDFLPWIQTNAYALVKNATTDGSGVVFNPGSTEAVMAYGDELFNTVKQYYTDSKTEISLNSGITINETGSILLFQILEASNPFAVSVFGYLLIEWSDPSGGGSEYDIDIAADNNKLGEDNYGDSVYLIIVPEGTTQISFVSSSSNKIDAIHDFYYINEIIEQPIDLEDEYIVTLEGLISNCSGYGFESIYSSLPEGTYYGFSIDDTDGTYPYFLIKLDSSGGGSEYDIDIAADNNKLGEDNYGDSVYLITVPEGTTQISFVSSSSNKIDAIHDFYYINEIIEQPIDLEDEYIVTLEGLISNCSGYGFESIYSSLPEGTYYGFSIDDTDGTYPYFLIKLDSSGGGSGEEPEVDLGTYECTDITLETSTGEDIEGIPVYIISLSKGYDGLLFQECTAKYKRVRIVSGSESVVADIATNNEITRDSDLFSRSASDFAAFTPSPVEKKANYDYLVFLAEDSGFDPPPMGTGPWSKSIAYVVVEWEKATNTSATVDKAVLEAEIVKVTGANAENYYQAEDRYNGKEYSQNGFWADMLAVLSAAQQVYDDPASTQAQVDTAVADLSAAVDKLIPVTQINATELYEAVNATYGWVNHKAVANATPVITEDNTTPGAWEAYQDALSAANAELALLFDAEGTATSYNNSESDAAQNVESVLTNLYDALDNLDHPAVYMELSGVSPVLQTAKMAYDGLVNLTSILYDPENLNRDMYTSESWNTYLQARAEAMSFLEAHSRPDKNSGYWESIEYTDAYSSFWRSCYEDLIGDSVPIHVELSIIDNYDLMSGGYISPYAGTYSLVLDAENATVEDALITALGSDYDLAEFDSHYQLGVYLNGIYLFDMYNSGANAPIASRTYNTVQLKDGDSLVVSMMYAPVESAGWTGYRAASSEKLLSDVWYHYIYTSESSTESRIVEGSSGQSIMLHAGYMLAHPMKYNGIFNSIAGAHVYVSEAFSTEEEARKSGVTCDTGVVTGTDGSFGLALYSAPGSQDGWYIVNLVCEGEKGGLSNGPNVLIHVTDGADLSELKENAKDELDSLMAAYDDDFYTSEQLDQINQLYTDAVTAIDQAVFSGDILAAKESAATVILNIQQENTESTERRLLLLKGVLEMLPTSEEIEEGKLYKQDMPLLDILFGNDGIYSHRMTPYQKQNLSVYEDILLRKLESIYKGIESGTVELDNRPSFRVSLKVIDLSTNEELTCGVFKHPNCEIFGNIHPSEDESFLYYDIVDFVNYEGDFTEIYLPEEGIYRFGLNCYLKDQASYKLDHIDYGIDDHYLVPEMGNIFYGLRSDTEVIMYVVPNEAIDPSANYIYDLEDALNTYNRNDYTPENWALILDIYNDGKADIKASANDEERQLALETALSTMAAVEKKPVPGGDDILSADGLFNAGKQVGTVVFTAENTTYAEGPFTGIFINEQSYPIGENDTMMTVILRALSENGYTWNGSSVPNYGISYLSSIEKNGESMGEFSGSASSGWMGSLNDFLVNEGFPGFSVAQNKLSDGDTVKLMFTQTLGEDLGGKWGDNNTTLISLDSDIGTIAPVFTPGKPGGEYSFALMIPGNSANVKLTPIAANKNFLVKTFLNEKVIYNNEGNSFYKRTESIPVRTGDTVYVGVGERYWPCMNDSGTYQSTWYVLHVINAERGADYVNELIEALPAPKNINTSNYKYVQSQIDAIEAVIEVLSASEQTRVNSDTLETVRTAADGLEAVMELKEELAGLPSDLSTVTKSDLQKVKDDYDYLTDAQKALLTVAEQAKVERVIAALEGIIIEETAIEKLSQDVSAIEGADWSVDQASANGAAALKSYIEEKLAAMSLSGTPVVDTLSVEPAVAGALTDPDGTDGSYSFTVTLSLDGVSQSVTVNDAVIKATEYIAPVDYEPVLKAVEEYLAEKVTDPAVASVGGEWAVFALNRGGVADSSWNYKYIENLKDYVDDCGGRLHDKKYTEYSRVVLALTSMGVDPTQFATDSGTYDLVSPLLDKQNDTEYWAEWQGNNGTAFALLALDSHGYLNDEAGNAARARFIESLKAKQLESGGWNIDSGAADLDTTAAVVYALAPYYLDATKLDELNCSVSHDELKAMVDSALEFLSGRQNANGGYGSAEADCWTIIALSSLGRDANSDAAFVKNGHTLLSDMLSYYDEETGAFRHLTSGSVDGMATEQAAYTLVAYDRFVKGQNTLYDMSDVTFRSGLSMAEELIDSITEPVSLADEDKIEAARAAYDALSDEEKASLDPGKIIKLEAAEKALSDLKVAKAEELIDAIGSPVRLSDENAIGKARNYYNNELSDAERAGVGNYDKLTSAESALQKLKSETPQGQTKSVTVTINGVTYEVSEATKKAVEAMQAITDTTDPAEKLPEDFRDLTPEKEKQILDAYSLYNALTPDEKLFATNYDDFYKNVLLKLGESYHYDERTDTDARDNDDDILPWYVKMSVEDGLLTDKQKEDLASVLGEDFTERAVYRISFTDAFTGEAFEPDELISLSFPADGLDPSRTPVFVFVRDDGSFEFIDGRTVDGRLVMQATDFGTCAVTDSSYTWDEILSGGPSKPEEARSRSWALPAGIGIALLVIAGIVILIMRRRREDEE